MEKLYGDNYGYRSGLNSSMVYHLNNIVNTIEKKIKLKSNDIVLDIGSNDGTLLKCYKNKNIIKIGIDPTIKKFSKYYPKKIVKIPEFFSAENVKKIIGDKKIKVITSIAMFYDLPDPQKFVNDISNMLDDNGVWIAEQSYMPLMIKNNSYDTIMQEHLEYYSIKQFKWLCEKSKLNIVKIEFNETNGGSFRIYAKKANGLKKLNLKEVNKIYYEEIKKKYNNFVFVKNFKNKILRHKKKFLKLIKKINRKNKLIYGYGASTKGNIVLQYCKIDNKIIKKIADVNDYKHGRITPGSKIEIISEEQARNEKPDFFVVFPWHFKKNFIKREKNYIKSGGKLIFPFPKPEIYPL